MDKAAPDLPPLAAKLLTEKNVKWGANIIVGSWILKNLILPRIFRRSKKKSAESDGDAAAASGDSKRLLYKGFDSDMKYLLRVCFPSWQCKEAILVYVFCAILLSRSMLSLVTAEVDGYLVKQLINREKKSIMIGLAMWLGIAVPSSVVNALIKYLQSTIALRLRNRISKHVESMYFTNDAYYKLSHHLAKLPSASNGEGIVDGGADTSNVSGRKTTSGSPKSSTPRPVIQYPPNTEQAVTEGITQWADRFADVIASLGKPMVDVTIFIGALIRALGWRNEVTAVIAVMETGKLLRAVRPNFAQRVQDKNNLEARFRGQYTRVVSHGEEIAFYGGEQREKGILVDQFNRIVEYQQNVLKQQCVYGMAEEFLTKYVWSAVGMFQVAVPLMTGNASAGDNAKYLVWLRRIMTRAADAGERLMQGVRDIGELSGYTRNLMNTIHVLRFLNEEKSNDSSASTAAAGGCIVSESEDILVEQVPLETPLGDVLIDSMNLHLTRRDRLLILGPNGCGKSTLFRILCGLWTARTGRLSKPKNRTDLLFLPQRPYTIHGTIIEQVVYPCSIAEADEKRKRLHSASNSLEELVLELLAIVDMVGIATHYGLNTVLDWNALLSGGEKQRLGLTRVFFHKPKYAILDECNSTLDTTAEDTIFERLTKLEDTGIITISHRHTLFKFHSKFLTYDGCGGYTFHDTTDESARSQLDSRAAEKISLITLLMEACKEVGENWPEKPPSAKKVEE